MACAAGGPAAKSPIVLESVKDEAQHHCRAHWESAETRECLRGRWATMATPQPAIGDWYRLSGGALFEVVALDDHDGTIEIQYFDGTVEEMDIEDWETQWEDGALEAAEAPEDWSGSVDVEPTDEVRGSGSDSPAGGRGPRGGAVAGV